MTQDKTDTHWQPSDRHASTESVEVPELSAKCGRTMNPQTYALLLEIARISNVTPQEALERIAGSVLEQAAGDPNLIESIVELISDLAPE